MAFNNCNCNKMGKIKNTHLLGLVNRGNIAQPKSHLIEVKSCHTQDPQRWPFEDQIKYRTFASIVEFKICTTLLFGLDSLRYNITLYIYIHTNAPFVTKGSLWIHNRLVSGKQGRFWDGSGLLEWPWLNILPKTHQFWDVLSSLVEDAAGSALNSSGIVWSFRSSWFKDPHCVAGITLGHTICVLV